MNPSSSWLESGVVPAAADTPGAPNGTLDLLMDMELPVLVRFGTTRMRLGELMNLGAGSAIEFERASENMVEILVNNQVVARGEAVVVQGNYGVRILEIVSAQGRIPVADAD